MNLHLENESWEEMERNIKRLTNGRRQGLITDYEWGHRKVVADLFKLCVG